MSEEPDSQESKPIDSPESAEPNKKRPESSASLQLTPEVIEDLKRRYGVVEEPPQEPEPDSLEIDEPLPPSPPPLEVVVIDTVGGISPLLLGLGVVVGLLVFILLTGGIILFVLYGGILPAPLPSDPIAENFDAGASNYWDVWQADEAGRGVQEASFSEGGYRLINARPDELFWSAAGLRFGAGIYEVDVTFETVEEDSGAGIAVLLEDDQFILFEMDPNGYVWLGRCEASCLVATPLTGDGWYAADAINTDFNATNRLTLVVKPGQLIAFINDSEVGFVANESVTGAGDVAFVVEGGADGMASVLFDNFSWTPNP